MNKSDLKDGMIVTTRIGIEKIIVGECLVMESYHNVVDCTNFLSNYNDDLTRTNNYNSEDIMKIEYGGKVIWKRGAEWDKVPFGTKVKVWDDDDEEEDKLVGRFIYYNEGYEFPFLVFVENEKDTSWFRYCEIIEEEEDKYE